MIDMPHTQQRTTPPIAKSMHKRKLHAIERIRMSTGYISEYSLYRINDEYLVRTPNRNYRFNDFMTAALFWVKQVEECKGYDAFFRGQNPPNSTLQLVGWLDAQAHAQNTIRDEIDQRRHEEQLWKI